MSDGIARISPEAASDKANSLRNYASDIERILEGLSKKMAEIDDETTGTYHGGKKPSELRAELDNARREFGRFKVQIDMFAANIDATVASMLAE